MDKALLKVLKVVGGRRALAKRLGISRQAVQQWRRVPLEHMAEIERLTAIPARELRPDLYRLFEPAA